MKANFYTRLGLVKAQIIPDLSEETQENKDYISDIKSFAIMYLNPDSWTDTKSANWIKHQVPGRSDPIQQWLASGVRSVSFDALVTADLADDAGLDPNGGKKLNPLSSKLSRGAITTRLGNIGRQMFNIPDISIPDMSSSLAPSSFYEGYSSSDFLPLSIADQLDYYRSLVYPVVEGAITKSPSPVRLLVGTTLGQRTLENSSFVVDKIEIKITKQYPDLTPIEAIVSFNLSEIVDAVISSDDVF